MVKWLSVHRMTTSQLPTYWRNYYPGRKLNPNHLLQRVLDILKELVNQILPCA